MSDGLRCWRCGVEPFEAIDISTLSEIPGSRLIPGRWPDGDHPHEVNPPTPEELIERGRRSFDRTMRIWLD